MTLTWTFLAFTPAASVGASFTASLYSKFGLQVMMEMYARWAHRVLWHDFVPGWAVHKSHHEAREGPFEANDIFAVMNAVPAIALTAYGFFTPSEFGGMCFGLGMGITVFGIAYMFVHDGTFRIQSHDFSTRY